MTVGSSLKSGYSSRKAATKKRSLMPMINKVKSRRKPKSKPAVTVAASRPAKKSSGNTGERIKVKKSAWRGRWHKE